MTPFCVVINPALFTLVATALVVMISGITGVVTVVALKPVPVKSPDRYCFCTPKMAALLVCNTPMQVTE